MTTKPGIFYGYIVAAISFITLFLVPGLSSSLGIFFKPIQNDLEWTRTVISGAFSLSLLSGGILGIAIGKMNDQFGPRVVLTSCVVITAAGYLLLSLLYQIWQLYLFLGILVGSGTNVFVPLLSTVTRWFVKKRSLMTGLATCGAGAGMLIMPLFISFLLQSLTWRNTFLLLGLIILIIGVTGAQFLKGDPEQVGQTALGADNTVERLSRGETGSFAFKQAMCTRPFWLLAFAMFFFGNCFFSIQLHLAAHVTDLGFSPADAARVLSIIGGAHIVGLICQGILGDRIGNINAFTLGPVLLLATFIFLIFGRNLWAFYFAAAFFGLAAAATVQLSPITALFFGLSSHGQIFGFFMFSSLFGGLIGQPVFGYIFDKIGSYLAAFIAGAILTILFMILVLLLRKPYPGRVLILNTTQ